MRNEKEKGYLREALSETEKEIILDTLRGHNWMKTKVADSLGISRSTLYRKLRKYGISTSRYALAGR